MLSRWVTRPEGLVCVHASVKCEEDLFTQSERFQTKEVVRSVQAADAGNGPTLEMALGVAFQYSEGLYRVEYHGHRVILVPVEAKALKKLLLAVCHRQEGAGHRGVDATMARLEWRWVWEGMACVLRELTWLCLY